MYGSYENLTRLTVAGEDVLFELLIVLISEELAKV